MNIIFKGINSETIEGLKILELPPITKPKIRTEEIKVDGVDGSIIEELGYESYYKTIKIGLVGNYGIDNVIKYFTGAGKLILSNESDKYYNARIIDSIDFNRLLRFKTANVKFLVQPYKYEDNNRIFNIVDETSVNIYNLGNTISKPIIKITGSGTIELSLEGIAVFSYTFPEGDTEVVFDSEKQDAYLSTTLKNRNMNGEFIILNIGRNILSWTGTITKIEISNQSRWL